MFDIDTEEFLDLNDLTPCDSEYTLLEAIDINDNDEIIANARIRSTSKYVTGVDVISTEGETIEIDSIVAVKLSPTGGSIDDCSIDDDGEEVDDSFERSGASTGLFGLMALSFLAIFRRKLKK